MGKRPSHKYFDDPAVKYVRDRIREDMLIKPDMSVYWRVYEGGMTIESSSPYSPKSYISAAGRDYAEKHGFLDEYMDSLGQNMRRAPDAWEKNWGHKYV